jgi:hypothetical protein
MKSKVLLLVIALLLITSSAFAATATVYNAKDAKPYLSQVTMSVSTTSTSVGAGVSTAYYFSVPMSNFFCTEIIGGVTHTTNTTLLEGTLDNGTTWTTLATSTSTVSARVDSTGKGATGIRINNTILTSGAGTKTTTFKCTGYQ